jgi:LmbE family N-acetylglucosaminyl deacetylase
MRHAVAVSPHLDDAVFSCGATLAGLAAGGWEITLVTVFTAAPPGAADEAMGVRRAQDRAAAERLGVGEVVHLGLPEAPHRGYETVFTGVRDADDAPALAAAALGPVLDGRPPDRILAPLGLDGHVDHLVVGEALEWLSHPAPVVRWRDTPYALREVPPGRLPGETGIPVAAQLERKLAACAAYVAEVADHFGGEAAMRAALTAFHEAEGRRLRVGGPAEVLVEPPLDPRRERAKRREREREERAALAKLRAQIARS